MAPSERQSVEIAALIVAGEHGRARDLSCTDRQIRVVILEPT